VSDHGQQLADAVGRETGITRENLLRAFASVPRERFIGPPPWRIARPAYDGSAGATYQETNDLASVYSNVSVALDPERQLYNGAPATVAVWIDALNPHAGERVFHVGCATGYYTAILATLVGPTGPVIGVDVDESLIDGARAALSDFANVAVTVADGLAFDPGVFDVALVSAGVSVIPGLWLSRMSRSNGRLVVPLTVPMPSGNKDSNLSKGIVFVIERMEEQYNARTIGGAIIFTAAGSTVDSQRRLLHSLQDGDSREVRSLRRDHHVQDRTCWLHEETYCLSRAECSPGTAPATLRGR